jgi:hypothetical protein
MPTPCQLEQICKNSGGGASIISCSQGIHATQITTENVV